MTNQTEQQENQSDPAFDSIETERRLAMEFPRHNWLVKHIMKEKKKKVTNEGWIESSWTQIKILNIVLYKTNQLG